MLRARPTDGALSRHDMNQPEETRIAPRKVLRCRAKVMTGPNAAMAGRTVDISMTGICVIVDGPIKPGHTCMIYFETPVKGIVKQVNVVGKVVYSICGSDGFRTGFQFGQLTPTNTALISEIVS